MTVHGVSGVAEQASGWSGWGCLGAQRPHSCWGKGAAAFSLIPALHAAPLPSPLRAPPRT